MAKPPLVLLVDDIPDHARRYEAALKQHGYRVHLVHTAAAALPLARTESPSCVVIDVRLPDMSGWDLCRAMKAEETLRAVPVVILTSDVSQAAAVDGAGSGCAAWLAHPAAAHDVPHLVGHVLAQDRPSPQSHEDAVIGVSTCGACGSENIKATLRLGNMQYFACRACNLSWRVESAESVA